MQYFFLLPRASRDFAGRRSLISNNFLPAWEKFARIVSMKPELDDILDEICERDPRYKDDAYEFVLEALSYTQKKRKRIRHVSGGELLDGIRDLLVEQFGPMTLRVLDHWGIKSTEDFGNIVFNLVERRVLSKTDEDTIESFRNVYDLETVFNSEYRNKLAKQISRLR
jgi:uncharacterized repeat protein (TIGR04138 family)